MIGDEVDLSCSESSAGLSLGSDSPQTQHYDTEFLVEYRVLDRAEASSELERQLAVEEQTVAPARYLQSTVITAHEREWLVDSICLAGEKLGFSFVTKALAVNLLDRYLATNTQLHSWFPMLAAVACLSIAAKLEEVCRPPSIMHIQAAMFWDVPHHSADIKRMELAVLSALEWRTWAVTVANLLDPLIFSLDLLEPAPAAESSYEKLYILRESCKLILAKTLRDDYYLQHRPSALCVAAVHIVLQNMSSPFENLLVHAQPLQHVFSSAHSAEVRVCKERLRATLGNDRIHPDLKNCTVEVGEDTRVVRVFRQQEGNVTPTSVLQSAHTGFCGTADLPHSYFDDVTPKMGSLSSEGRLCPEFLDLQ